MVSPRPVPPALRARLGRPGRSARRRGPHHPPRVPDPRPPPNDDSRRALARHGHMNGSGPWRVLERIGQQVAVDLAQPGLVAEHDERPGPWVELDRPVRLHGRASCTASAASAAGRPARARAAAAGRAGPAAAGPRRASPSGRPRPRPARITRSSPLRLGRRPGGRARRSRGSRSAGCAARGWRRRRTAASGPPTRRSALRRRRSRSAPSIALSDGSRPTSVRSSLSGTRRLRSPAAIAPAVRSTSLERTQTECGRRRSPAAEQGEDDQRRRAAR